MSPTGRISGEKQLNASRWEERIWSAIGDGRLLVYSQPIVDIATGNSRRGAAGAAPGLRRDVILRPEFLPECERYRLIPFYRPLHGRAGR